jgi:threonyl-tRNA synthetase
MSQVTVTLPDGSSRTLPAGSSVRDVAAEISPGLAKAALAGIVDGKLVDLAYPLNQDASVRIVTDRSPEALPLFRHSTAHLLAAAAVTNLFPGTQCVGPATGEGFFYDFVVASLRARTWSDRKEMKELARGSAIQRQLWPREDAKAFFASAASRSRSADRRETTAEGSLLLPSGQGDVHRLLVGPHVPSTGKLKAFKLLNTSNAYWKGDARNQPMQRVYGTAFLSDKDLKAHLTQIEEAKKRDHRKLGKELGLFTFHPWAPGAAFWQAKGTTLYHALADYMRGVLLPNGYVEVKTPLIFNKALWETSGHWSHYRHNMFLVQSSDDEQMAMKAMNCPGHYLLYASEVHSYRELPIRFHEQTPLHRNEASGVLSGLTRVRQFSRTTGRACAPDQIGEGVERLLRLVRRSATSGCSTKLDSGPETVSAMPHRMRRGASEGRVETVGESHTVGAAAFLRAEDRLRHHRRHRP